MATSWQSLCTPTVALTVTATQLPCTPGGAAPQVGSSPGTCCRAAVPSRACAKACVLLLTVGSSKAGPGRLVRAAATLGGNRLLCWWLRGKGAGCVCQASLDVCVACSVKVCVVRRDCCAADNEVTA